MMSKMITKMINSALLFHGLCQLYLVWQASFCEQKLQRRYIHPMFEKAINPTSLQDLKIHLQGELIVSGDDDYNSARKVWNGMIDKYPAAIARCTSVSDIVAAVKFARSQQLGVAVRSGGHSYPGHSTCDGGLVIDLSRMKAIQVDPGKRTARVQAGVTLAECIREMQKFGLGWLMGKYGLTMDSLMAVEMVTADG